MREMGQRFSAGRYYRHTVRVCLAQWIETYDRIFVETPDGPNEKAGATRCQAGPMPTAVVG